MDAVMQRPAIYHSDPGVLGGTPVFTGTRVPVDTLIVHLQSGTPLDAFLDDFPGVSREQAVAFLGIALEDALERVPVEEPA